MKGDPIMRWFVASLFVLAASLGIGQQSVPPAIEPPQINQQLPRGARRTPVEKIIESIRTGKAAIHRTLAAPPAQVIVVPPKLSMWGNSQYGDCVSAESAFSMAAYSTYVGLDEIFIPEANVISWARSHGFLNGADLLEVIQAMQADGIKDDKGILRKAGVPSSVKYSDETTLQSAIAQGPISIAIDANALPSGAGNKSGWSAFYHRQYPSTDHCVGLSGYGPTSELFKTLGVPAPSGAPTNGYLLFTWNTIGVVDHGWLLGTCVEAWVRNPTITGLGPSPTPPPGPSIGVTVVVGNVTGTAGVPVKISPMAVGGTSPYIFLFAYGDLSQDASGTHTYQTGGSYTVTVTAVDSKGQVGTGTCIASIGANPTPPPGPIPSGLTLVVPQNTPAGTYQLVLPSDIDEIQRRLDLIRGKTSKGE